MCVCGGGGVKGEVLRVGLGGGRSVGREGRGTTSGYI